LALLGFPGAAGAVWLGLDASLGFFGFCIAAAVLLGLAPDSGSGQQGAAIGIVQSFGLACGLLFVSLYQGFLSGLNNLLFGTIVGVTDRQVVVLLIAGVVALVALAALGRPLLFASIDEAAARSRGVPTRLVGIAFLVLLGVAAAGASEVTGTLLVFALLVAPAATAVRLTSRPVLGLVLSVVIALVVTWLGEGVAFFSPYPIGFWVTTFAFGLFLLASGYRAVRR